MSEAPAEVAPAVPGEGGGTPPSLWVQVLLGASMVEWIAAAAQCWGLGSPFGCAIDGTGGYAIALGTISTCLVVWMILARASLSAKQLGKYGASDAPITAHAALAAFICLWWLAGAVTTTFFNPFTATSNGYFAVWTATVCSGVHLLSALGRAPPTASELSSLLRSQGPATGLLVCSASVCGNSIASRAGTATEPLPP